MATFDEWGRAVWAELAPLEGWAPAPPQEWLIAAVAWAGEESGWDWAPERTPAHNNAWNTTEREPDSTPVNSAMVESYPTWAEGIQATVVTLRNGYYGAILAAMAATQSGGTAEQVAKAVASTPWGTPDVSSACSIVRKAYAHFADCTVVGSGQVSVQSASPAVPITTAPTIGAPTEWSDDMQAVPVHIPALDGQGNGWVTVPGAAGRVVSVKMNGADPEAHGYLGIPRWSALDWAADARVVIEGGAPNGELDLTVWLAAPAQAPS